LTKAKQWHTYCIVLDQVATIDTMDEYCGKGRWRILLTAINKYIDNHILVIEKVESKNG